MNVNGKYLKDENGETFSPITSTDSVYYENTKLTDTLDTIYNFHNAFITNLTVLDPFVVYDSASTVCMLRCGRVIDIRGAVKPTEAIPTTNGSTAYKIVTIDSTYAPSQFLYTKCQGSYGYSWLLTVTTDGAVKFSRYSDRWKNVY